MSSSKLVLRPVYSGRGYSPSDAVYDWYAGSDFICNEGHLWSIEELDEILALGYTKLILLCGPANAKIDLPTNLPSRRWLIANNFPNNRHIYATAAVVHHHDGRLIIGEGVSRKGF
jgi:hypothetical protein